MIQTTMIRLAVAVSLCSVTIAQVSEGPFIGLPAHMLVDDNTTGSVGTLPRNDLYLKRAGFDNAAFSGPSFGGSTPDFSFGAMFPVVPAGFHLGSISSGFHTVYATWVHPAAPDQPVLNVPGNAWVFMFYSVTKDTNGEGGSVVQTEASATEGPGGDMFSIVLPGSNVPAGFADCVTIGQPDRANDSSELGLLNTTQPELRDFDPFFTFYEDNDKWNWALDPQPSVYFTLSNSVAASVSSWYPIGGPSGATILRIDWTGSAWTSPVEFVPWFELGLLQTDEIDAVSVDELAMNVALSLKKTPTTTEDHQLMVASFDPATPPPWHIAQPFLYDTTSFAGGGTTQKVTRILGADDEGDLDAVCIGDPNSVNGVITVYFPYIYGCRPAPTGWNNTMSTSAWMSPGSAASPTTEVAVSVSGLQNTPGALVAFLLWGPPATPWDPGVGNYDVFDTVLGWDYALATSQTARVDLTIPNAALPVGTFLDLQWLMLSSSGIYQSNVTGLKW